MNLSFYIVFQYQEVNFLMSLHMYINEKEVDYINFMNYFVGYLLDIEFTTCQYFTDSNKWWWYLRKLVFEGTSKFRFRWL